MRDFLGAGAAAAAGAIVAACAPAAPQIIEVEKQVPVEKVVKEVERIMTAPSKPAEAVTIDHWFPGPDLRMPGIPQIVKWSAGWRLPQQRHHRRRSCMQSCALT